MSGRLFSRSLIMLLCGLATLCPSSAQDGAVGQVQWRTDYNLARREALDKKLPILIDFFSIPCPYCDLLDTKFFQDPTAARVINERFIPLKINGKDPRNAELIDKLNIQYYPTMVLASFDGKVINPTIVGYREPRPLYDHLLRVLSTVSDSDWMLASHQQAVKHFQAKEYARAVALLRTIVEDGKNRPVQLTAQKMLHDIEEMGQARLTQAREKLNNRQSAEAIEIANEMLRDFAGLQVARDAGALLAEVMQQSADVRHQHRGKKAQELLAQVQESYKNKDYLVCIDRCDTLVKNYGDLPEAQEAYLISANIKNDSQWLRGAGDLLVERLGNIWLDLAEYHAHNGQPEQARYYFERVVRAFPGTRQADFAQTRLNQFGNSGSRPVPAMTPVPGG